MGLGLWGSVAVVAGILAGIIALMTWGLGIVPTLSILFIIICVVMMLIILAQKPRGGGLAGAFGGAGGGGGQQTAFGAKTGDVMTWSTIVLFVMFILVAMGLTWTTMPAREADQTITQEPLPAQTGAAGAADTSDMPASTSEVGVQSETSEVVLPGQTLVESGAETTVEENEAKQDAPAGEAGGQP